MNGCNYELIYPLLRSPREGSIGKRTPGLERGCVKDDAAVVFLPTIY